MQYYWRGSYLCKTPDALASQSGDESRPRPVWAKRRDRPDSPRAVKFYDRHGLSKVNSIGAVNSRELLEVG